MNRGQNLFLNFFSIGLYRKSENTRDAMYERSGQRAIARGVGFWTDLWKPVTNSK